MAIKLMIFDMAGTTVHDKDFVNLAFKNALEKYGYSCTRDEINEIMGMPKPLAIRLILEKKLEDPTVINSSYVNTIHATFQQMMIDFYASSANTQEIEGVSETFRVLKDKGIKIGIDTGFDRKIANAIFDKVGWAEKGLIDFTVTSDEVERGRPYPDMVFRAMSELGITDSNEVAKVGDTPADLNEGNSAGCGLNIAVLSGAYNREELEQHPHTHIVDSVVDIPELLQTV